MFAVIKMWYKKHRRLFTHVHTHTHITQALRH